MKSLPQLHFDDGSRAMLEQPVQPRNNDTDAPARKSARAASVPIFDYYEIERLCHEVEDIVASNPDDKDTWNYRVALQFPDDLLLDAPEVCWEFERLLENSLVFVLGDTTYAPCCPDTVAAAHLQADVLVHYGHACLSVVQDIPVLYSFGKGALDVPACVNKFVQAIDAESLPSRRLLLLYEVQYEYCIQELKTSIGEQAGMTVVAGTIPETNVRRRTRPSPQGRTNKESSLSGSERHCCDGQARREKTAQTSATCCDLKPEHETTLNSSDIQARNEVNDTIASAMLKEDMAVVGGLEFPIEVVNGTWSSEYTVLFIGRDDSRQYLNIVLLFLSSTTSQPSHFWTFDPVVGLNTGTVSPRFHRTLSRRFYLVQKARECRVFGILVASLNEHTKKVVASLRQLVADREISCYTFVVGKINPAKLANFPEIDCFVLVACPEHSLLADERELYPIPIVTPTELLVAFNVADWGTYAYSTQPSDYWKVVVRTMSETDVVAAEDDDKDAPYFSLISGTYESSGKSSQGLDTSVNLTAMPGKGVLTTYNSAAAQFLSQREYQGMVVATGEDEVLAAIPGKTGIASHYSDR